MKHSWRDLNEVENLARTAEQSSQWKGADPLHPCGRQTGVAPLCDQHDHFGTGIRFPDRLQPRLGNAHAGIKLPKLCWLRLRLSQQVQGAARDVSITREGSGKGECWFASIQVNRKDLRITNMSASARGTAAQPGKCVGAKVGPNRVILDAAWDEFARQFAYKVQRRGGRVILLDAAYTSRACRACDHQSTDSRKTQALVACVACGKTENADMHAATNILARAAERWSEEALAAGRATSACAGAVRRPRGASRVVAAVPKQEPAEARALA